MIPESIDQLKTIADEVAGEDLLKAVALLLIARDEDPDRRPTHDAIARLLMPFLAMESQLAAAAALLDEWGNEVYRGTTGERCRRAAEHVHAAYRVLTEEE